MKRIAIGMMAAALGMSFAATAAMGKAEYDEREKAIEADYKAAKESCKAQSGNASDICVAEAKGNEKVAKANLEYAYAPTAKSWHSARVTKADATYDVAVQRCDDKSGNVKDVCVKEAKAAKVHAVADADTQMKTWNANVSADGTIADANAKRNEKVGDANAKAAEKASDANRDAASDKRSADYAVAKQKCDALAGAAKDACVNDAKARFGQN